MKQCDLDLAMVFRCWWLLGYSGKTTSISDLGPVGSSDSHSEHPYMITRIVHKSVHANCAQPHVKLVSIQVQAQQVLQAGG